MHILVIKKWNGWRREDKSYDLILHASFSNDVYESSLDDYNDEDDEEHIYKRLEDMHSEDKYKEFYIRQVRSKTLANFPHICINMLGEFPLVTIHLTHLLWLYKIQGQILSYGDFEGIGLIRTGSI